MVANPDARMVAASSVFILNMRPFTPCTVFYDSATSAVGSMRPGDTGYATRPDGTPIRALNQLPFIAIMYFPPYLSTLPIPVQGPDVTAPQTREAKAADGAQMPAFWSLSAVILPRGTTQAPIVIAGHIDGGPPVGSHCRERKRNIQNTSVENPEWN